MTINYKFSMYNDGSSQIVPKYIQETFIQEDPRVYATYHRLLNLFLTSGLFIFAIDVFDSWYRNFGDTDGLSHLMEDMHRGFYTAGETVAITAMLGAWVYLTEPKPNSAQDYTATYPSPETVISNIRTLLDI